MPTGMQALPTHSTGRGLQMEGDATEMAKHLANAVSPQEPAHNAHLIWLVWQKRKSLSKRLAERLNTF